MSRKSRKKREAKLQAQRDRRTAVARLGAKPQVRAVKYQESVQDGGVFRCPECSRQVDTNKSDKRVPTTHASGCANMQEEVERAQLADAREKRQRIHEGTRDVIPDKPKRLTRGPAATRKIATDMVQSLKNDDLTMYGVRQIVDEARDSNMSKRDLDRVKAAASERWNAMEAERMQRGRRFNPRRSKKHFRPGKKL